MERLESEKSTLLNAKEEIDHKYRITLSQLEKFSQQEDHFKQINLESRELEKTIAILKHDYKEVNISF